MDGKKENGFVMNTAVLKDFPSLRILLAFLCFCILTADVGAGIRQPYKFGLNRHEKVFDGRSGKEHPEDEKNWKPEQTVLRKQISVDPQEVVLSGRYIKECLFLNRRPAGKQDGRPETLILIRSISGAAVIHLLFCILFYFCLSLWWHGFRVLYYIHEKDGKKKPSDIFKRIFEGRWKQDVLGYCPDSRDNCLYYTWLCGSD